jgi:hypothetical protein
MAEHHSEATDEGLPTAEPAESFKGYRRCLCSFIDVLGFRDLVLASCLDQDAKLKLHTILKQFQRNLHHKGVPGDRENKEPPLIVRAFSDSIVRIVPLDNADEPLSDFDLESEIVHELIDLCGAQFDLLSLGILVRGGFAIGDIYWDDHQIFGPALIEAYDLESKTAVYPRIVLSNVVSSHIREGKVGFMSASYRREDFDGTWFADYLGFYSAMLAPNIVFSKDDFHKPFEVFRFHIADLLAHTDTTERIREKHLWLAKYFNSIVAAVPPEFTRKWSHLSIDI